VRNGGGGGGVNLQNTGRHLMTLELGKCGSLEIPFYEKSHL
jgi:hypothetical protein